MNAIFNIINIPFGYIIRWFDSFTGNYLLTLLLFCLLIKLVLLPVGIKQQKNQIKQARLRPKEMAIRKKYAGRNDKVTQQKVQQEVMDLYQRENFNPMGGCLPMLVQLLIVISLYQIIRNPLTYICGLDNDAVTAVFQTIGVEEGKIAAALTNQIDQWKNILAYGIENIPQLQNAAIPNFMFLGLDFSQVPTFTSWLVTVPILVFVSQFGSMKLTRRFTYQAPQQGDAAKSMLLMDIGMPLMSVWFAFIMPAALGAYWIMQSAFSLLQSFVLAKLMPLPTFTEEDYRAAEKEVGRAPKSSGTGKKAKSLHHIDDDDDIPAVPPVCREDSKEEKPEGKIEPAPLKDDPKNEENGKSED